MRTEFKWATLIEVFNEAVQETGSLDRTCLEIITAERCEAISFGCLRDSAKWFAGWLRGQAGIERGCKVAILGRNRVDWDVAFWGAVLAGGVPVLIDPERGVEGVMEHLVHTGTAVLVMAGDYADAASRDELRDFAARRNIGLVEMLDSPLCESFGNVPADFPGEIGGEIVADDTAVILCTSGTTADPREVELTHANIIANVEGTIERINITSKDTLVHILPPHHSFGLTVGKVLTFAVGATNVYTNKYRRIAEIIAEKEATIFIAIPALFTALAKQMEATLGKQKQRSVLVRILDRFLPRLVGASMVKKLGWEKLRFCLSGAAAMPLWVLEFFWRHGLLMYEGYGTTENSPVYGFNDRADSLGSVGRPIPTLEVKIVDEENNPLEPGGQGEILLGGPCIMKGYYKNPKATDAAIDSDVDGVRWLHTGDLGYLDRAGNLFITGRKKFIIVLPGGKNVNPELVETALCQASFVYEILVVPGFKKDGAGIAEENIRAIVRPEWEAIEVRTSRTKADLIEQPALLKKLIWHDINECQQNSRQLSSFEKISSGNLEIRIEEFEKTSTGKIKRRAHMNI
ncbi:MAG: AMP-binding protein [Sedimentisphaerales bacterium]|nr:AMP-binding protein [Sedimentisphaerales bacterium]